jgi:hypothetical protein
MFLKGLVLTAIAAVLSYLSTAANLEGVFPPIVVTLITLFASRIENYIQEESGKVLFGAARIR